MKRERVEMRKHEERGNKKSVKEIIIKGKGKKGNENERRHSREEKQKEER